MDTKTHPTRDLPAQQDYECCVYHLETYLACLTVRAESPQQALEQLRQRDAESELDFIEYCGSEPANEFIVETPEGEIRASVPEHCLYAQQERNRRLLEAVKLALDALNEAPSFRIRHAGYRTSYQVCTALEQVLRELETEALP